MDNLKTVKADNAVVARVSGDYDPGVRKLQSWVQCEGITKAGRRCSIDSHSKMKNERGKLVGEPLQHGSRFCLIHAQIFQCAL